MPYWRCVLAALPALLVGAQYVMATRGVFVLDMDREVLTTAMQAEFLVIGSMFFVWPVAVFRFEDTYLQVIRGLVALALAGGVIAYVTSVGFPPKVVAMFFAVGGATYFGVLMSWNSPTAGAQFFARFILCFVFFMVATKSQGAPWDVGTWAGKHSVLRGGAVYFTLLAAVELTGLYLKGIPRLVARMRAHSQAAAQGR